MSDQKTEYRIPGVMWIAFAVLVFFLGALYQKNQMLQGGGGILGVSGPNVSPTAAVQQQAAQPTFKPFDYQKETGTYAPLGNKDAKVKIVVFSDFECPYCAAIEGDNTQVIDSLKTNITGWQPAMPNIVKDYVDAGKAVLYFRDFTAHQDSKVMHNGARCANEQDKFWEFHDALFKLQDEGGVGTDAAAKMNELAANLGLDTEKFSACLQANKYQKQIDADMAAAQEFGVQGTPQTFINDKYISGADGYAAFKKIIEEELKK
jgi:protein-disulfide isomerase